jgi:hypothetical protein
MVIILAIDYDMEIENPTLLSIVLEVIFTSRKTAIYDCRNDSILSRTSQKRLWQDLYSLVVVDKSFWQMQLFRTNHLKSYLEVHLPFLLMWTPTWEVVLSHDSRAQAGAYMEAGN